MKKGLKKIINNLVIESLNYLNSYDLNGFCPIFFNEKKIGYINEKNYNFLFSKGFFEEGAINIDNILSRNTYFFDEVFEFLINHKYLVTELREKCPVFDQDCTKPRTKFSHNTKFGLNEVFSVERALLSIFGFPAYGVHMNGWKIKKGGFQFLMAKRSKNVRNFTGLYDNLVGGGQPSEISIIENLKKESLEEANIDNHQLSNVKFSTPIKYLHTQNNNFSPAVIFSYDLEISNFNSIKNNDGEIESFHFFSTSEIFDLLGKKLVKPNCILPILDFLVKRKKELFSNKTINEIKKLI